MEKNKRVCPWWLGYFLLIPIRKLGHNPDKILGSYIKEGMNVLDFGCAMGFFSLPLARMTGVNGKVYCVDVQEKMLDKLQTRAKKAGVGEIIKPLLVGKNYNVDELRKQIDFTMLFAVAHEVPDQKQLFADLYVMLKSGGKVLFAEPKGHVTAEEFKKSLKIAKSVGFRVSGNKPMEKGLSAFLVK